MSRVELRGVQKTFDQDSVIHGVDLEIESGELVVFVGPSGCGKSTLLRLICGLEHLTGGEVLIDGRSMRGVGPAKRGVAMVFQTYALYPHMTVSDNMGFALRMSGMKKAERVERVAQAARILRLEDLLKRLPKQLSGGQRQRVAIGRAIVRNPKVFLFDEPLSNLDAELRVQMRLEILSLHRQLSATMVYVTHDQVEAMTMADRIVVLKDGRIEQIGTPVDLYSKPENLFVAGFIGSPKMNLLAATVTGATENEVHVGLRGIEERALSIQKPQHSFSAGDSVIVGIRPDHFTDPGSGQFDLEVDVAFVENLGGANLLHAPEFPAGAIVVEDRGSLIAATGKARVAIPADRVHLFNIEGQAV